MQSRSWKEPENRRNIVEVEVYDNDKRFLANHELVKQIRDKISSEVAELVMAKLRPAIEEALSKVGE